MHIIIELFEIKRKVGPFSIHIFGEHLGKTLAYEWCLRVVQINQDCPIMEAKFRVYVTKLVLVNLFEPCHIHQYIDIQQVKWQKANSLSIIKSADNQRAVRCHFEVIKLNASLSFSTLYLGVLLVLFWIVEVEHNPDKFWFHKECFELQRSEVGKGQLAIVNHKVKVKRVRIKKNLVSLELMPASSIDDKHKLHLKLCDAPFQIVLLSRKGVLEGFLKIFQNTFLN